MTPDKTEDLVAKLIAAPRREKRLTPAQRREPARLPAPPAPSSYSFVPTAPAGPAATRYDRDVARRIAAMDDPAEILQVVETEAALRRAQRLTGSAAQQRHALRLLSVLMLFALVIAAVGAMWYLQTTIAAGRRRPPAAATATDSPAPAASARPAAPDRRSPAPGH